MPNRTEEECWELVLANMNVVHYWARWARKAVFPSLKAQVWDYDDFVQEGIIIGLSVAERYDESKGKFSTILTARVKWAMFDLVHPERRNPKAWGKDALSLDMPAPGAESPFENCVGFEEMDYDEIELQIDLEAALLAMSPRDAWIIGERVKGRTLLSIADELGVSESRISQICTQARPKFKKLVA